MDHFARQAKALTKQAKTFLGVTDKDSPKKTVNELPQKPPQKPLHHRRHLRGPKAPGFQPGVVHRQATGLQPGVETRHHPQVTGLQPRVAHRLRTRSREQPGLQHRAQPRRALTRRVLPRRAQPRRARTHRVRTRRAQPRRAQPRRARTHRARTRRH